MSSSNRNRNFSSQRSAIPFGKFESGSDDVFPCNESMVGREGARAKLIDFLTNAGTRKAILVTGRRGMGKTSFVNYCLKEYEEARIERYWRSDIGRTFGTWLWLLLVSMICTAAFVSGNQLLETLLLASTNNHLLWISLLPLIFCLSYPLFHAIKIFSAIFRIITVLPNNFIGYLCVLGGVFVFFHMRDNGSPIIILSSLLVMLAAIYLAGELLGVYLTKTRNSRLGGVILVFLGSIVTYLTNSFNPLFHQKELMALQDNLFFSNLVIASILFGLALFFRAVNLDRKPKHISALQIGAALKKIKFKILLIGGVFYLLPLVFIAPDLHTSDWSFVKELKLNIDYSSEWITFFQLLILISGLEILFFRKKEEEKTDAKYQKLDFFPSALLIIKAGFFILLSLYALHPLITQLRTPAEKLCIQTTGYFDISYILKNRSFCDASDKPENEEIIN